MIPGIKDEFIYHFYHAIEGWFDFNYQYTRAVNMAKDGARFLEIGTANGKSAAYMAVEIANSGKDIEFFTVDIFEVPGQEESVRKWFKDYPFVKVINGTSLEFAEKHKGELFDFIWLDGCHKYETVMAELNAFYPMLKEGGMIGGHDYYPARNFDVKKAVDEFFKGKEISIDYVSWKYIKKLSNCNCKCE